MSESTQTTGTQLKNMRVSDIAQSCRKKLTRAGQIVDAVLMPVAPHAAVIPGKFFHGGKFCSSTG